MPFARTASYIRLAAMASLSGVVTLACLAQEPQPPAAPTAQNTPEARPLPALNYVKPASHFPNPVGPYIPKHVADPNLANTARIDQLMHDGKLYLSLNDAIALALENNLDIAVARYNLEIADTDILRARSGQGIRGVASGLVQGTPGGGQGGFGTGAPGAGPGGTSAAAGGAGTGTSGLVQSTTGVGPAIEQFDPSLTGTLSVEHASSPLSNTITTGVPIFQQNTTTGNFSYSQGFATGTDFSVGLNNNRQ